MVEKQDASCVTDLHICEELDEVEIISLITEHIPKYRLRADTLTEATGYANEDWVHTPIVTAEAVHGLSPPLVEETLKYFLLCSERVTQMTKTYNDIEAVTQLLEEKERDVELAARIGQTLLEKNKELEVRSEQLEEQVTELNDTVAQMRHEVSLKDSLLAIYVQDHDYGGQDSRASTPTKESRLVGVASTTMEHLNRRLSQLEGENCGLKDEMSRLCNETATLEEREHELSAECVLQLAECKAEQLRLEAELVKRSDECSSQHEEICTLLAQLVDLQDRIKRLTLENCDLGKHVEASRESQGMLTAELGELRGRHEETLEMLHEQSVELRDLREQCMPKAQRHQYSSLYTPFLPSDSLASELDAEMRKSAGDTRRRSQASRVFETVKAIRRTQSKSSRQSTPFDDASSSLTNSAYLSDTESLIDVRETVSRAGSLASRASREESTRGGGGGYAADTDSVYSMAMGQPVRQLSKEKAPGQPGQPGSRDLSAVVRRLKLRQEQKDMADSSSSRAPSDVSTPTATRTGGSDGSSVVSQAMSSVSSMGLYGMRNYWPEKLQIVKPMEGSVMLNHWKRLATPSMGGLLEEREGVQVRGEEEERRAPAPPGAVGGLTDLEEDDEPMATSRSGNASGSTYTLTVSNVLHPGDRDREEEKQEKHRAGGKREVAREADEAKGSPSTGDDSEGSGTGNGNDLLTSLKSTVSRVWGFANILQGSSSPATAPGKPRPQQRSSRPHRPRRPPHDKLPQATSSARSTRSASASASTPPAAASAAHPFSLSLLDPQQGSPTHRTRAWARTQQPSSPRPPPRD